MEEKKLCRLYMRVSTEDQVREGSSPSVGTSDESVRTIRTLYININSIWVDFFVIWKIILLGKDGAYDKYY